MHCTIGNQAPLFSWPAHAARISPHLSCSLPRLSPQMQVAFSQLYERTSAWPVMQWPQHTWMLR